MIKDESVKEVVKIEDGASIKENNLRTVQRLATELAANIKEVDLSTLDDEVREQLVNGRIFVSQTSSAPIELKDGRKVEARLELKGMLPDVTAPEPGNDFFITLASSDLGLSKTVLATRQFRFTREDDEPDALSFTSDITVSPDFERIGLGTAFVAIYEEVVQLVAEQLSKNVDFSKIKLVIVDGTSGKDQGWTTQMYENSPDWVKLPNGSFVKTIPLTRD